MSEPLTDNELLLVSTHTKDDLCKRAVAEIRELRGKLDRVMSVKSIRALLADNAKLRAALEKHGRHAPHCNAFGTLWAACCCGLHDALKGSE